MKNKYLVQCKYCGHLLFKTEIISIFQTEIRCPGCGKIVILPDNVIITLDKKKKKI